MLAHQLIVRPLPSHLTVDDGQHQLTQLLQTLYLLIIDLSEVECIGVIARSGVHDCHHGMVQICTLSSIQGVLIGLKVTVTHLTTV